MSSSIPVQFGQLRIGYTTLKLLLKENSSGFSKCEPKILSLVCNQIKSLFLTISTNLLLHITIITVTESADFFSFFLFRYGKTKNFIELSQELFDPIYPDAINVVLFSDPMNTIQREISTIPATQHSLPFMVAFSLYVRKQNEQGSLLLFTYSIQRKYSHKYPEHVQINKISTTY